MTTPLTERERAKGDRRRALLDAAASLFARRGFAAVTMAEVGSAAGVSGPALYRHFAGKQAILDELLTSVSRELHAGGTRHDSLDGLIAFHVRFAVTSADVISVQDRDLASASAGARDDVRRLQRAYAAHWVGALEGVRPDLSLAQRTLRVHAVFGLINSTPHALRAAGVDGEEAGQELRTLARAALLAA